MEMDSSSMIPPPPPPPPHSHKNNNKKKLNKPSTISHSCSTISNRISSSIKDKTCPICLSHIAGHRPAIISPCLHAYCLGCLLRWSNYKRTCPLCNSSFNSYFSSPTLSSRTFQKHRLLPLHPPLPGRREREIQSPSASPMAVQRVLRRRREEINVANRRSRPVPHQRSFGQFRSVPSEVIAERVLQWRASIYKLDLWAVPFTNKNPINQNMVTSIGHRERILQRIEPWIRRELQAILQDPDPTVIVHVATSLYLSTIEKKRRASSRCPDTEDTFLAPIRPFLHEWTNKFWHELRCFAESSFTMDTYDEVVEYRNQSN